MYMLYHPLGGYAGYGIGNDTLYDTVLSFNIASSEWEKVNSISHGRYGHAVSTVPKEEVLQFCQSGL